MGVEMPAAAVEKILAEQHNWEKERKERTGEYKRLVYSFMIHQSYK